MVHTLPYPREVIAERVALTPADHAQIALCRGPHNRLGFGYQLGFLRLTGRFPTQQPLEILDDLLIFMASELAIDPEAIRAYARRQATVSHHQEQLRTSLGLSPFGQAASEALSQFVFDEACRLEQTTALLARAEEFLRARRILLPAASTLRRLVGEHRERARQSLFARLMALLPAELPPRLDALLLVDDTRVSALQMLKEPPGAPSPRAVLRLTEKLDRIAGTGILAFDLAWLNNNFQKALARRARHASAHRLRELQAPHRYTVLVCFLTQTHRDTIDDLVDMQSKLVTDTYRRAQHELDEALKQHRTTLRETLHSFRTMGQTLLDEQVPPEEVRAAVFRSLPPERLQAQLLEAETWLTGSKSDVFPLVMKRFSYLRQFAPSLLEHLSFEVEPPGNPGLLEAIALLRTMQAEGNRKVPEDAPLAGIPSRLRSFAKRMARSIAGRTNAPC